MDQEKKKQVVSSDKTIEKTLCCTWKGIAGILLTVVGVIGHLIALPFCDLTLIACNSSTAIIINVYISWKFLGEQFVPKYDISAMVLVFIGTLTIILISNKDQESFPLTKLLPLLCSLPSLAYFAVTMAGMISQRYWMPIFLRKIREFEADCETWDKMYPDAKILPVKNAAIDDD